MRAAQHAAPTPTAMSTMKQRKRQDGRVVLCICLMLPLAFQTAWGENATPNAAPTPPDSFFLSQRAHHLSLLGADRWLTAGYRGQGIKVAILDLSFRGYRDHLGKALPAQVRVACFRNDGDFEARNSEHGILCAEVVHALAPDADLLLATWEPDDSSRFLEAVRWARREGAQIISCSVITPSWSDGDGGGPFHQALAKILGDGSAATDMMCFASSGNTALRHWSGRFHAGAGGFHEWLPGLTDNTLKPWGRDRVSVELYGPAGSRYEISVRDSMTGLEIGCQPSGRQTSTALGAGLPTPPITRPKVSKSGAGSGDPRIAQTSEVLTSNTFSMAVRFIPKAGAIYQVRVRLMAGPPGFFHLVALGGRLSCATAGGSVPCPADGPEVIAVGAVTENGRRAGYSSYGSSFRAPKPDVVAPVPFPLFACSLLSSELRPITGARNEAEAGEETGYRLRAFAGTSAAAPQAAGLAALLWSRHPDWTARQVRATLLKSTQDVGPPGIDLETGYGMIRLPATKPSIPYGKYRQPGTP
jgi:hypothetical protein